MGSVTGVGVPPNSFASGARILESRALTERERMEVENAGYTGGEIVTVVSQLFDDVEPEDINHAAVIIFTNKGEMEMVGCKHAPYLVQMVANDAAHHAFHSRSNYESHFNSSNKGWIRRWLGGILL